ncbi:MAG TPA: DUF2804 domain-containing protein [Eubacteriales bacterium]|jgi:hypothetical protein|nr:DUF2804 domain-containing protein [Clostridia bacterium]HRR89153.1 DUF2804 domain-containing protein [Eubacteriales bacterium]HRU84071.1 DUF2804 domain-containing protein [Eubacteriales bacterium]
MSNQHQVTVKQKLFKDGLIAEPGYAKNMVWEYSRDDIKAKPIRIKEWDYYIITNKEFALALTLADNGFIGAISASVIDYKQPFEITKTKVNLFPMGRMMFPSTPESGDVMWRNDMTWMEFRNDGKTRRLIGEYIGFGKNKEDLRFDVTLTEFPEEYMVIATPFKKPYHFYFNAKINCMRAEGSFKMGDRLFKFDPADSLGTLDWGRGVWTYDNTWYWGSAQTRLPSGDTFGFNIGYGFGDTSQATENMLFFNGKSHKLDEVVFNIPQKDGRDDFMSPWTFSSNDGRFETSFYPIVDRYAPVNLGVIAMIPHQVFGKMSGKAVLDDGRVIEFSDLICFAEKVHNRW